MNFLSLLPLFSTLVDRLFPDKNKQDEAKAEMQRILNDAEAKRQEAEASKMESQSKVIVAEASSQSYAARNWRPHLMYSLMAVIPYNYIVAPVLMSFGLRIDLVPIPPELWTVLSIGLGGYIGKDAIASYTQAKFNEDKFFNTIRNKLFVHGMTQAQVDAMNEAVKEAQK